MFQVLLDVPFAEKDDAKALGAKWDPRLRKWYVPSGRSPVKFERWMPEHVRNTWRHFYGLSAGERKVVRKAKRMI